MLSSFLALRAADRRRWLVLAVVCLAQLMLTLDVTVVNVALPSIQHDLHFTQSDLTWVVNAFLITFGSLLLLAGRLSDLIGRKRLFISGLIVFTAASALCGVAPSQCLLIAARALQGIGAAMQASVILAIIVTEFPEPDDRARAMSAYVFTAVAGGSLGLLAGGALTEALSWHWIFFINLPIGLVTATLGRFLIARDGGLQPGRHVDYLGSLLVTSALMIAVYGIVEITTHGLGSLQVLGSATVATLLMAAFVAVESRVSDPILPPRILRLQGLVAGNVVRGLLVTGMYSTFFLGPIYLERVLHYSAIQAGLSFLPWTLSVAALSLGTTARLVKRFGARTVLVGGMGSVIVGLGLLTGTGPQTSFFPTLFLGFLAIGLGVGSAFMPLMTIAMADVPVEDAGLGSGITTLSQQVGGALGLAILGTIAATRTRTLIAEHTGTAQAIVGGDHLAYVIGAASVLAGIGIALTTLRAPAEQPSRIAVAEAVAESPALVEGPAPARIRRIVVLGPVRPRGGARARPRARRGDHAGIAPSKPRE